MLQENVRIRLKELSQHLSEALWLDKNFSAGDLIMITVLRRLKISGLLNEFPNILAYIERGEARPAAFQRRVRGSASCFHSQPVKRMQLELKTASFNFAS